MMFINDLDVLNANMNGALYRTQSATNSLQQQQQQSYDTTLQLQSNANSLAFCQQKSSGFTFTPQTTVSYSTSRHDLTPTPPSTNNNIYSTSIYSHTDQQQQQAPSSLIPLNIAIFNPALSCNYAPAMQSSIFPQVTAIPSFANFNNYPKKCKFLFIFFLT